MAQEITKKLKEDFGLKRYWLGKTCKVKRQVGQERRASGSGNSQGKEVAAQQNHTMEKKFSDVCLSLFVFG